MEHKSIESFESMLCGGIGCCPVIRYHDSELTIYDDHCGQVVLTKDQVLLLLEELQRRFGG